MGSSRLSTRLDEGVKYGAGLAEHVGNPRVAPADQRVELVGADADDHLAQGPARGPLVAVLAAPRPQPARKVVERVLARHAHRAVGLVGVAGRVARGLVGEQLGRGDLEPRRSRLGGTHRRRERDRDDHRLLRAVHEVRLHRLERADRLAELAARRGVLERDLLQALERAAPSTRCGRARRAGAARRRRHRAPPARIARGVDAVEVHRVARARRRGSPPARCARRRGSTCTTTGPSSVVEQRHDLVDGPRPRARGARCRGARRRASTRSSRRVPGTTVTAPSGISRPAPARSQPPSTPVSASGSGTA